MSGERRGSRGGRRRRHDNRDMILMALSDSPQTLAGIKDHFFALPRRFGIFSPTYRLTSEEETHFEKELAADLERLSAEGLIRRDGERFGLTEPGRKEAETRLAGLRRVAALAGGLIRPEMVSRITVGVHLALAAVKLPAAILSGSSGLLNDALDTLLDGLSSVVVYFGVRSRRERAANLFLVVLMLSTGALTMVESARRLFVLRPPDADPIAFAAIFLSGFVCLFLSLYQRYAGLKSSNQALIIQSVDSRNHVLVAFGVAAGLIAALLHFPLLDTIVGLLVAALILRSGIEQAAGLIRSWESGEPDFSRYSEKFFRKIREFRKAQLRDWMLFLVETRKAATRDGLAEEALRTLTFDQCPVLREIGSPNPDEIRGRIDECVDEIFVKGWLAEAEGSLHLTPAGKRRLRIQTLTLHRGRGHSLVEEPEKR